jgi:2-polyprenyl-3-methyl-5-hydroxy-6-metoxy-1,4-benzoquinol methylase
MITPNHLGGHGYQTHIDPGALDFLKQELKLTSFLDVGCGVGHMVEYAKKLGLRSLGIDGDPAVQDWIKGMKIEVNEWDYTKGPFKKDIGEFDLVWSVEFLEHVDRQHISNIMDTFRKGRYVIFTHALPHQTGGHHHVNLQPEKFWIEKMKEAEFDFDEALTHQVRLRSTMRRNFMRETGKVFVRRPSEHSA